MAVRAEFPTGPNGHTLRADTVFAHTAHTVAQANVAIVAANFAELGEAAVLPRDYELVIRGEWTDGHELSAKIGLPTCPLVPSLPSPCTNYHSPQFS